MGGWLLCSVQWQLTVAARASWRSRARSPKQPPSATRASSLPLSVAGRHTIKGECRKVEASARMQLCVCG